MNNPTFGQFLVMGAASALAAVVGVVLVPMVLAGACVWGVMCGIGWLVEEFKKAMEKS
jgi:polyferredoxin